MSIVGLWVPVLAVAHLLAVALLLYSIWDLFFKGRTVAKLSPITPSASTESFRSNSSIHSSPVVVRWESLSCWTRGTPSHQILFDCTGTARSGQIIGIMGPSGAGKSTLMDVIFGERTIYRCKGDVHVNKQPASHAIMSSISSFVPQNMQFVPSLSVEETVVFRARLTPATVHCVRQSVADALAVTGLQSLSDHKVGGLLPGGIEVRGLSGGELRRLAIACALIGDPQILFMDEPTSWLDSYSALRVMHHISNLAHHHQKLVFCSIHQPRAEIFDSFSRVLVLSKGHQVFMGSPDSVQPWFSEMGYEQPGPQASLSDWMLDTVSIGFESSKGMSSMEDVWRAASRVRDAAAESIDPIDEVPVPQLSNRVSWIRQCWVLGARALIAQLRNPTDTAARLLVATWIGLLTGLVFYDLADTATSTRARLSAIYYILLAFQLLPFSFMSFFVADRRFFLGDVKMNLYCPSAYFVASSIASYPCVALNTICSLLVAYGLAGLRAEAAKILSSVGFVCLHAVISQQFLIMCVWLTSNQDLAYVLSTAYVAACILLSGFFIRIKDVTLGFVRALSWIIYSKYSFTALARVELQNRIWLQDGCRQQNDGFASPPSPPGNQLPDPTLIWCGATGNQQLSFYGYSVPLSINAAALLGFLAFMATVSYLALRLRV